MKLTPRVLAVTMGDPAGIGPEIVLKALARRKAWGASGAGAPAVLLVGDRACFDAEARRQKRAFRIRPWNPDVALRPGEVRFCQASAPSRVPPPKPGRCGARSGCLAADAILAAAALCNGGVAHGMATAPVNKDALRRAGIPWPGHTEWLAHLSGARQHAMLFVGERLRVVLATIHLPLRKVPAVLTSARIVEVARLGADTLRLELGVRSPRIAVAGLNPHAGEAGLLGDEDRTVVAPAVRRLRALGYRASGPHPGDTVFRGALEGGCDLVVAMYHDQGLGPLKTLEGFRAVNVTVGLPWIRTSVDHGTAEDIAGRGIASDEGMLCALRLATRMMANR